MKGTVFGDALIEYSEPLNSFTIPVTFEEYLRSSLVVLQHIGNLTHFPENFRCQKELPHPQIPSDSELLIQNNIFSIVYMDTLASYIFTITI